MGKAGDPMRPLECRVECVRALHEYRSLLGGVPHGNDRAGATEVDSAVRGPHRPASCPAPARFRVWRDSDFEIVTGEELRRSLMAIERPSLAT